MFSQTGLPLVLVYLCLQSAYLVFSVGVQEFYPFGGKTVSSSKLKTSSISDLVELQTAFNLYGKPYNTLRVHTDGVISLGNNPSVSIPLKHRKYPFPPKLHVIAPFYAPGVITSESRLTYGETRDAGVLARATRDVRGVFMYEQDFSASAVFVATWDQVKHVHHLQEKKNNTFQAVLISDGVNTFVLFNYAHHGLRWTKGYHVHWRNTRQYRAQAGFSAGDHIRVHTLPGSGTKDIVHLVTKSNMNSAGQWMFKVGWTDMDHLDVQPADSYVEDISPVEFFVEQYFEGCYIVHGYLGANRSRIWAGVTVRSCMMLCNEQGLGHAALHNGTQCACMSDIQHLMKAKSSEECNMPCTANREEICGGRIATSVYEAVAYAALQSDQSAGNRQRNDLDECATGAAQCHVNATCINASPGYCCKCVKGFYGNGKTCLKIGAVQRMIGFMSGSVNGHVIRNLFMDTIAYTNDGRAYVATRGLPPGLAHSLRILTPLTDVIGWMYGTPKPDDFPNGYRVVGLSFTRNATVEFDAGEVLNIHQKFQGKDYNSHHVQMVTTVQGIVPVISPDARVKMTTFQLEFSREGRGRIESRGTVKYQVDGVRKSFTVEQIIEYNEQKGCVPQFTRCVLEAEVLMTRYDQSHSFMGIAIRGTVRNGTIDSDDVQNQEGDKSKFCGKTNVKCHKRGVCITYRGRDECRCNYGYLGDGVTYCNDANECKLKRYRCDSNADCINTVGSYKCRCKNGYIGDGKTCRKVTGVQCPQPCHSNGKCVKGPFDGSLCVCKPGYIGSGFQCKPDGSCEGVKCDPNAKCLDAIDNSRKCVCNSGYQGDGRKCTQLGLCGGVQCSAKAQCMYSKCACNSGYEGDGQRCSDSNECLLKTHRCDANADCINTVGSYRCHCRAGYTGDGFNCQKVNETFDCDGKKCHANAQCFSYRGHRQCVCVSGYHGDGIQCQDMNECQSDNKCDALKAVCSNTVGSYRCTCRPGYSGDGRSCSPVSPCGGEVCHRFATCQTDSNTGTKRCRCREGFRGNGVDCDDMDECIPVLRTCDPNAMCRNTLGSYECMCRRGFVEKRGQCISDGKCNGFKCDVNAQCDAVLGCVCHTGFQGNGINCTDLNECEPGRNRCDPNADCLNTAGSFECRCGPGFVGNGFHCTSDGTCGGRTCAANARCIVKSDGRTRQCVCNNGWRGNGQSCLDIDECQSDPTRCTANADCINNAGSYECRCKLGFSKNGSACIDLNECEPGRNRCDPNADCLNTAGSFECRCGPGFVGNGFHCTSDGTCGGRTCAANARCIVKSDGRTRQCVCNNGWRGNGQSCLDIDECQSDPTRCTANADCINNAGSYECRCKLGFSKNGSACIDKDECRSLPNLCHSMAVCVNTVGSYFCRCRPGFKGDGKFCQADGTCAGVTCHPDATCQQNTAQGTICVCKPGYLGDGRKCADINECTLGKHNCHKKATCTNTVGSYKCKCNLGYVGNGTNCADDGSCRGVTCDPNSQRVIASPSGECKTCKCNDGFSGNGEFCKDIDECIIGPAKCNKKAECINNIGSFTCRCIRGYVGDGLDCKSDGTCEGKVCDFNGQCVAMNTNKGIDRTCQCKEGFKGDGIICTDANECLKGPCPKNSKCTNTFGSFLCQCNPGYKMIGGVCQAHCRRCLNGGSCVGTTECQCPKGYSGKQCQWYGDASLVFTKGNSVQRISLPARPNAIGLVYQHEGMVNVGLDYDCVEEYVYWTEIIEGCIMRAKYDGSNMQMVIQRRHVRSPEGIAVDWMGRNLYWTDTGLNVIEVSRLNGTNRRVLISNGLHDPRAILVDPPNGKMYWSDWTRRRPRIEVASMDGSNRRVLVYDGLGLPNGLTLVQSSNELCYTDAGTWSIRCVDLGGLNVRKVIYPIPYPFGIANFNRTLYWTDWMHNRVQRIGVQSNTPDQPLKSYAGKNGKIFDVKVIQPCPAKAPKNPCSINNGGCVGLCLLKPHGHSCVCPKGQFLVHEGSNTVCRGKCNDPLGIEKGTISDAQLTASSAWNNNHKRYGAHRARLNIETWPAGWNAKKFDPDPWLQIDLGSEKTVTAVATQGLGHNNFDEWVKTYRMSSSSDGETWFVYQEGARDKVFIGNSDRSKVKRNGFKNPLKTRWLRIHPRTWNNHVALRVELYGC